MWSYTISKHGLIIAHDVLNDFEKEVKINDIDYSIKRDKPGVFIVDSFSETLDTKILRADIICKIRDYDFLISEKRTDLKDILSYENIVQNILFTRNTIISLNKIIFDRDDQRGYVDKISIGVDGVLKIEVKIEKCDNEVLEYLKSVFGTNLTLKGGCLTFKIFTVPLKQSEGVLPNLIWKAQI